MDNATTKRRRRRPARSCEQCRRRKIRCDMQRPCRCCVLARTSLQCSYRDVSPGADSEEAAGPTKRRKAVPIVAADPNPENGDNAAASEYRDPSSSSSAVPRQPRPHPRQQHGGPLSSQDRPERSTGRPPKSFPVLASKPSSTSIAPIVPWLRHVPDKTKFFGETHWIHIAAKFPVLGAFSPVEVESAIVTEDGWEDAVREARSMRALKRQTAIKLEEPIRDLQATLPSRKVCGELARCYFHTFEPLFRCLHIPSFWDEYNRLWEPSDQEPVSKAFLIRLTLILALGTTFFAAADDAELSHLRDLSLMWIQNAQWWLTGPAAKKTHNLEGIQIFCLLLLAQQATFDCGGICTWLSPGSLLQMALAAGLHRDPYIFPSLSPADREIRARLWATVMEIAVQHCIDSSTPLTISTADYDVGVPSNLNDCDLSDDAGTAPTPAPLSTFTDSSLQILLAKTLPLRIEVARFLHNFRSEQSYEQSLELSTKLRAACREIATALRGYCEADAASRKGSSFAPTHFHRKFMDIQIRRFMLFVHRNFMLPACKDPRFYFARKGCVEAALVILSHDKDADLSLPTNRLGEMSRLAIVGRGLFKGPCSFDALLIICLEVITQLQEAGVQRTEADALDEMAQASREPLLQAIERMRDHMFDHIQRGRVSFRVCFAEGYLAQARAMQEGRPVREAVFESTLKLFSKCVKIVKEKRAEAIPLESVSSTESLMTDLFPLDMFGWDPLGWDMPSMPMLDAEPVYD